MKRKKKISGRKQEQGIILTLVALFMLGVIGAMAALSIDVVTLYTARSEAQLAADGAALAAARVLANSGMTSDPTALTDGLMSNAWTLARNVALQVARQNQVGGANLTAAEVTLPSGPGGTYTNPTVTVTVRKANLPTFFARIWGSTQLTVSASATAEAYNPSGAGPGQVPVAPICVKPWLLPNLDPTTGNPIFDAVNGSIKNTSLLGWTSGTQLQASCTSCSLPLTYNPATAAWTYYPGANATFPPPPPGSLSSCTPTLTTNYQESIAGCIQTPITCNRKADVDTTSYSGNRNTDTADAVNCLTHATNNPGGADQVDSAATPAPPPFQFLVGANNPLAVANPTVAGKDATVSSSLATVPVFDANASGAWQNSGTNLQIVGFVQLFLNPDGSQTTPNGRVNTTIVNLAGCGTGATGTPPILGNGASPVAVRLISPP